MCKKFGNTELVEKSEIPINQTFNSYYLEMKYNWKEYYSAWDLYNAIEQEIKNLKEKLSEITMVADDEKQSIEHILELEKENRKLKEERDFFKEQAILWRKDYKNEYEKNRKLEEDVNYWHHRAMKAERGE